MLRNSTHIFVVWVVPCFMASLILLIYIRSAFISDLATYEHYLPSQHAEETFGVFTIYGTVYCNLYWEWTDVLQSANAKKVEEASHGWQHRANKINRPFFISDLFQFHYAHNEMDIHPGDVFPKMANHESRVRTTDLVFPLWPMLLFSLIPAIARLIFGTRRKQYGR